MSYSVDNWQTALRKQYLKRAPDANPLGPAPIIPIPEDELPEPGTEEIPEIKVNGATQGQAHADEEPKSSPAPAESKDESAPPYASQTDTDAMDVTPAPAEDAKPEEKVVDAELSKVEDKKEQQQKEEAKQEEDVPVSVSESRDWLELSMLEKLDSLHLLTEWQFQNPHRLRQIMKSDNEDASWVRYLPCSPSGRTRILRTER